MNHKVHYCIGVTLGDMGNYEAAIGFFDEALRLKPDFDDATLAKGFVLTKLGRKDEAKQCTDKLLETKKEQGNPKDSDYASLNDSCRQDYEAAQRRFKDTFSPPP
jgi:tetratricopeptide (TPR) repeat protein